MTFGLSITTSNGELLIDERFRVLSLTSHVFPVFDHSTALVGTASVTADIYRFPEISGPVAAPSRLDFWVLPPQPQGVYFIPALNGNAPASDINTAPQGYDSVVLVRPNSVARESVTPPEGYLFTLNPLNTPAAPYGIAIYLPDGTIGFDTNVANLQFEGITDPISVGTPSSTTPTTSNSSVPMPNKPAFFIAPTASEIWTRVGSTNASRASKRTMGIRRDGSSFTTMYLGTGTGFEDSPKVGSYFIGNAPIISPFINASLYD